MLKIFIDYAKIMPEKFTKCNYARSKPERIKLCQNYAKNCVSKVIMPELC